MRRSCQGDAHEEIVARSFSVVSSGAFGRNRRRPALNGFSVHRTDGISRHVDHNFLVDRTDPNERLLVLSLPPSVQTAAPDIKPQTLDDRILTLLLPKIGYQNDSKRHQLFATWVPQFEIFQHNTDQNGMSQQAAATFTYFLARNIAGVGRRQLPDIAGSCHRCCPTCCSCCHAAHIMKTTFAAMSSSSQTR